MAGLVFGAAVALLVGFATRSWVLGVVALLGGSFALFVMVRLAGPELLTAAKKGENGDDPEGA